MAQLGKAYIEVRADLSKFPAELRAELQKALREGVAGVSFKELEDKGEQAGKSTAKRIGDGVEKESKTRLRKSGEKAGEDLGLGLFGVLRRLFTSNSSGSGFFSTIGDLFKGFGKSAEDGVGQLQSFGKQVQGIGEKVSSTFSAIGGGVTAFFYVMLIPAVSAGLAILTELAGALLALPAAIALLLAAVAPLVIAFHGISDAVGAGLSGNVDKFNEALKKLAPSARSVVREIVALKPAFEAIKNNTQQAFFAPLVGSFKALQGTLLPALNQGLATAAGALGRFVDVFLRLLADPKVISDITATFATLARILDNMGPAAGQLFSALFGLVKTGLPFVQQFSDYLARGAVALANLINSANGSGKIASLIQGAVAPFKLLIQLIGVFGDLFLTIFGDSGVQKAGNDFLGYLIKAIGLLDEFFHSAEGKKVIKDFADAIEHSGQVLLAVAGIIIGVLEVLHYLNAGLKIAIEAVAAFFAFIGGVAVSAGGALIDFFKKSGEALGELFTVYIPQWFNAVVSFFASIGSAIGDFFTKTIPGWFDSVVNFFKNLPGAASDGLSSLGKAIRNGITDAIGFLIDSVSRGIGRAIGIILATPYLVSQGLAKLGTIISDAFTSALSFAENVVSTSINAIGTFFSTTLPNAISSGLDYVGNLITTSWEGTLQYFAALGPRIASFFVSVYHAIVDSISSAITDAKNFVVDGFNSVVDFMGSLPGRIAALGPRLLSAAKDLGRQIGNGLKDIGNFASDIGRDIVNTVKSGVNRVIDGINRGIGDIDNALPISLPRLPHLARGGIIDSPTLALIGEGGRREVVVPLTDPTRAQQLAQQSGLTQILAKGAGSPVVNITAILDGFGVMGIVKQTVTSSLDSQGDELAFGAR